MMMASLWINQNDYEAARRQVMEVGQAVDHGVITTSQAGSVIEGLKAIENNLEAVRSNAVALSVDHLDSGRDDANERAKDMVNRVDTLLKTIGGISIRITEGGEVTVTPHSTGGKTIHDFRWPSDLAHV